MLRRVGSGPVLRGDVDKLLHVSPFMGMDHAYELRATARAHRWTLDGIDVFELMPAEIDPAGESGQTMFHPSEVELGETMRGLFQEIVRSEPARIVVDSLSEVRLLAQSGREFDLSGYVRFWLNSAERPKGNLRVQVDIDPMSFY